MELGPQQASKLGIASYVDAGVNVAAGAGSYYALWLDALPGPQAGKFWRVHAMLAQMFCENNSSGVGGLYICSPGTPIPSVTDVEGECLVLPGHARIDDYVFNGAAVNNQLFQKAVHITIGGVVQTGYIEPNPPKRTIVVPSQHFIRFVVVFAGAVPAPNASNWYTLMNILYEQEDSC